MDANVIEKLAYVLQRYGFSGLVVLMIFLWIYFNRRAAKEDREEVRSHYRKASWVSIVLGAVSIFCFIVTMINPPKVNYSGEFKLLCCEQKTTDDYTINNTVHFDTNQIFTRKEILTNGRYNLHWIYDVTDSSSFRVDFLLQITKRIKTAQEKGRELKNVSQTFEGYVILDEKYFSQRRNGSLQYYPPKKLEELDSQSDIGYLMYETKDRNGTVRIPVTKSTPFVVLKDHRASNVLDVGNTFLDRISRVFIGIAHAQEVQEGGKDDTIGEILRLLTNRDFSVQKNGRQKLMQRGDAGSVIDSMLVTVVEEYREEPNIELLVHNCYMCLLERNELATANRLIRLANAFYAVDDYRNAANIFKLADTKICADGGSLDYASYIIWGISLRMGEEYESSLEVLEKAMKQLDPSKDKEEYNYRKSSILLSKALTYEKIVPISQKEEVNDLKRKKVECYKSVINMDPDNHIALNNLAYEMALNEENLDEALAMIVRALEIHPGNPVYLDTKGYILCSLGEVEQGMHSLENAIENAKNLTQIEIAEIKEHLGKCRSLAH